MKSLGPILEIVGLIILLITSILAWIRAMDDDEIDKFDIFLGTYIFEYPLYTVLFIIGLILFVIGLLA